MNRTVRPLLLCLAFAGCDSSSKAPAAAAAPAPASAPAQAAAPTPATTADASYCDKKKKEMLNYGVQWDDTLTLPVPANFPTPPEGARLCGTAPSTATAYYHLPGKPEAEVIGSYRTAFEKMGMVLNQGGVAQIIRYSNNELQGSGKFEGGTLQYHSDSGELTLTYRKEGK
jgi:hypothetical protein